MALQKFNQALDAERKAQAALVTAEDRRGELSKYFIIFFGSPTLSPDSLFIYGIYEHKSP